MTGDDEGTPRDKVTQPLHGGRRAAAAVPATLPSDPLAATMIGPAQDRALASMPERISRFEIKSKLGEGGMGVVLLAIDPLLGRRVALKVLHREAGSDSDHAKRRLLREAQGTAQLTHENVIVVHEVGTHEGQVYLAMEYVTGGTLTSWQVDRDWRQILEMYLRAGRGLVAAHDAKLVHRDFKPDNVLVGEDGRVRVTDFGLVAAIGAPHELSKTDAELRGESELAVSLTRTGAVMGTPRYMAPEQHLGEALDARADQFAFCAALYEALYRRPPFEGTTYSQLVSQVLAGNIQAVPADSEVPLTVREAVLRGLSRDRDSRFRSMAELLTSLRPALEPRERARGRRWLVPAIAIVVALSASVLAVGLWLGDRERVEPAVTRPTVEDLYKAGEDAYQHGRFDDAVVAFQQAYDVEPDIHKKTAYLFNIAQSHRQARSCVDAQFFYRRFLSLKAAEVNSPLSPTLQKTIEAHLAEIDECAKQEQAKLAEIDAAGDRPWALGVSKADQHRALELFVAGNVALNASNYVEASKTYETALRSWNHPGIHYNQALTLLNLDRPGEVLQHLDAALIYPQALESDKVENARATRQRIIKRLKRLDGSNAGK